MVRKTNRGTYHRLIGSLDRTIAEIQCSVTPSGAADVLVETVQRLFTVDMIKITKEEARGIGRNRLKSLSN